MSDNLRERMAAAMKAASQMRLALASQVSFDAAAYDWDAVAEDATTALAEMGKPAPQEPEKYTIGDLTMAWVFRAAGLTDASDMQAVFDQVEIALETLEVQVRAADALAEWVEGIIEDGCPACGGDCSSANPPPSYCPQKEAMNDLAAYRATKEGGAQRRGA